MRNDKIQHQQRDRDGKDTVTERFKATKTHVEVVIRVFVH